MGISRRQFLQWSTAASIVPASSNLWAGTSRVIQPDVALPATGGRALNLHNVHTGDRANVTYWENGEYLVDGLAEIYLLMRDHRQNLIAPIDVRLLDRLHETAQKLDHKKEIYMLSGYRSPKTNELLMASGRGVAKHSLHMKGQAIDIRLPGVNLRQVNKAARASGEGGVGYYRRSGFIHLDIGRNRHWSR